MNKQIYHYLYKVAARKIPFEKTFKFLKWVGRTTMKHPTVGLTVFGGTPLALYGYYKYITNPQVIQQRYLTQRLKESVDQYIDSLQATRTAL